MPGNPDRQYFSFNLGPVHFLSISTEYYYFKVPGVGEQFQWIEEDLKVNLLLLFYILNDSVSISGSD